MSAPASATLLHIGRKKSDARLLEERKARWLDVRPRKAFLYVENRCHLQCDHCYESEESHPSSTRMSFEEYEKLFDDLARLGVLQLTLSGGEIFLRKDLLDLVALARAKRFAVTLYTSGTLIDEEKADRLAALKVSEVHVSVYSHVAETHDDFTGVPGSHAKSVNAIRLLVERGVRVVLKSNITTFNVDQIDELVALAEELGADWQLDPSLRAGMNGDMGPLKYALAPEELRRKVYSRPDLATHFRKRSPEELCHGERTLMDQNDVMCAAGYSSITVGADGGVYACGFFPTAAGSLKERSLEDVWFGSAQLDDVRRTRFESMSACPSCDVKSTCHPCMAQSLIERGDHRECNATSRTHAEALHALAERKAGANRKMAAGRALPVLEPTFDRPLPKGSRLSLEP